MTLQRGFGAGMKESTGRGGASNGPRTFWVKPGEETTVVLLDDMPVVLYRHQLFLKGDKDAAQMRLTCAEPYNEDGAPRVCLLCNAQSRHKQIGRKLYVYLTVVDERAFRTADGRDFKDMRNLLELDKAGAEIFEKRKAAHGSLVGLRFRVYRPTQQNSARYGQWEKVDKVDLVHHFWYSPAIPKLIEASSRRGDRPLSHEQAVAQFITPFNYDEIMGGYKPADAERFLAYIEGVGGGSGHAQGGGGYQPPPPPGGGAPPPPPAGAAPAQPNYAVPASQVPQGYAAPPPPQQRPVVGVTAPSSTFTGQGQYAAPAPPQGQPQPNYAPPPPQGYQAPQPPQGYAPPPPPSAHAAPHPAPQGYAPPPPPQGAPPPGNRYEFPGAPAGAFVPPPAQAQGGWSSQPPGFAPPAQGQYPAQAGGEDVDLPF